MNNSGNIRKEHAEDEWNLQFCFDTIYRDRDVSIFLFFAPFLETFGWMRTYFLCACALIDCLHELRRFSIFLSSWPRAINIYQLVSPPLKMQMTINTLLDTCGCQLRETSCVIKITIVVFFFLIFNFKWFAEGLL